MSDTVQNSTDIASEILALAPKVAKQEANIPASPEPAKPVPPVVAEAPKNDYIVGEKVYNPHKKLLADGVHPRNISHISYGRWKGCQCFGCKKARGEMVQASAVQGSSQDFAADSFKEIIDEDIAAIVFDTPTRIGQIFAQVKDLPKDVQKVWETSEKELKVLGKLGKRVSDRYLNLPDFKHKEAVVLGVYMASQLSVRLGATIAVLKTMEKKQ